VPGGPVSSSPLGSLPPRRVKRSGLRRYCTTSCNSSFASSQPNTSANVFTLFSGCSLLTYSLGAKVGPPPPRLGGALGAADDRLGDAPRPGMVAEAAAARRSAAPPAAHATLRKRMTSSDEPARCEQAESARAAEVAHRGRLRRAAARASKRGGRPPPRGAASPPSRPAPAACARRARAPAASRAGAAERPRCARRTRPGLLLVRARRGRRRRRRGRSRAAPTRSGARRRRGCERGEVSGQAERVFLSATRLWRASTARYASFLLASSGALSAAFARLRKRSRVPSRGSDAAEAATREAPPATAASGSRSRALQLTGALGPAAAANGGGATASCSPPSEAHARTEAVRRHRRPLQSGRSAVRGARLPCIGQQAAAL